MISTVFSIGLYSIKPIQTMSLMWWMMIKVMRMMRMMIHNLLMGPKSFSTQLKLYTITVLILKTFRTL